MNYNYFLFQRFLSYSIIFAFKIVSLLFLMFLLKNFANVNLTDQNNKPIKYNVQLPQMPYKVNMCHSMTVEEQLNKVVKKSFFPIFMDNKTSLQQLIFDQMSNKFQTKLQEPQNLRQIFHQLQRNLNSTSSSSSLGKKLSPFKQILETVKKTHSPCKFNQQSQKNSAWYQNLPESTQSSDINENQKLMNDQQFLQLYHNDPIFKYRMERLMNEQLKKSNKDTVKVLKKMSHDPTGLDQNDLQMRTTFKARRSQNEKVLYNQVRTYRNLLKRQNSNQTSPSSEDN